MREIYIIPGVENGLKIENISKHGIFNVLYLDSLVYIYVNEFFFYQHMVRMILYIFKINFSNN